eukprot:scaffold74528_cov56-Cyclotella_meneghiniana.AAC.2
MARSSRWQYPAHMMNSESKRWFAIARATERVIRGDGADGWVHIDFGRRAMGLFVGGGSKMIRCALLPSKPTLKQIECRPWFCLVARGAEEGSSLLGLKIPEDRD